MELQKSFSQLERQVLHEFRNNISKSENSIDLENQFCYATAKVIAAAMGPQETVFNDDIIFDRNASPYFAFSDRLMGLEGFNNLLTHSDLHHVITRFANQAHHHYIHLQKHRETTEAKIYHDNK